METSARTLTGLLTGLAVLLLAGGIYYWDQSKQLTTANNNNERRADSLLSAKLRLEGDMRLLNNDLNTSKADNAELNSRIEETSRLLARNEASLRALQRSNAGRTRTIGNLNQDITRLGIVRDSLTAQMAAMHNKINWQADSMEQLTARTSELEQELKTRDAKLLTMVPRSAITADAFRVETTKRNNKETAKAKKVNALTISFSVPAELRLAGLQDVYLSLTDDKQNEMIPPLRTTTISLAEVNQVVPVHAVQAVNFGINPQRVSFHIDPSVDIKPGTYRASIFTKDAYLGSVEFRFRDSFWFF